LHEVSEGIPLKPGVQGAQPETFSRMSSKNSISRIIEAAQNTMFQHRWMTAETWPTLINYYYPSNDSKVMETGSKLQSAISRTQWFLMAVLSSYYAAPLGVQPTEKEKGNWFYYIDDAAELLKSKITRSSALKSNMSLGDSGIGEERKRPQNQETVKKSKDFPIDDPSEASIMPMSSSEAMLSPPLSSLTFPTVIDIGFWNSKYAKNLFGVKEGERLCKHWTIK
jgi:hypothetical protein